TARTIPHVSSSRIDVLTFERATLKVSAISSAGNAFGDKYSNAWICATVRLIPHRVPISPQWRIYCFCTPVSSGITFISVHTEYKEYNGDVSNQPANEQKENRGKLHRQNSCLTCTDDSINPLAPLFVLYYASARRNDWFQFVIAAPSPLPLLALHDGHLSLLL